jgi:hypothetical protein
LFNIIFYLCRKSLISISKLAGIYKNAQKQAIIVNVITKTE